MYLSRADLEVVLHGKRNTKKWCGCIRRREHNKCTQKQKLKLRGSRTLFIGIGIDDGLVTLVKLHFVDCCYKTLTQELAERTTCIIIYYSFSVLFVPTAGASLSPLQWFTCR